MRSHPKLDGHTQSLWKLIAQNGMLDSIQVPCHTIHAAENAFYMHSVVTTDNNRHVALQSRHFMSCPTTHSEHRFPAPSSLKEGCRKPVLGVWSYHWPDIPNRLRLVLLLLHSGHNTVLSYCWQYTFYSGPNTVLSYYLQYTFYSGHNTVLSYCWQYTFYSGHNTVLSYYLQYTFV